MTKEEFQKHWSLNYSETVPIPHSFKHDYSHRWFRIHSLPESKRYADSDNDWGILLSRQNAIITDILGVDTPIFLVAGEYNWGSQSTIHIVEEEIFKSYSFTRLNNIDLYNIDPEQYDEAEIYRPAFAPTVWKPNYHDKLLKEIANDNVRAFFVSFDQNVIVSPYDGGIDFILKDELTADSFRNKFRQWLSKREDQL